MSNFLKALCKDDKGMFGYCGDDEKKNSLEYYIRPCGINVRQFTCAASK